MGLLDSNVFKPSSKSINLTGAATTKNTYLNGGQGIIDVSKYSVMCFQVKTITADVTFKVYGGVTSLFNSLFTHEQYKGTLLWNVSSVGTYWVDISSVKYVAFYITNAVENGVLDIDICFKNTPVQSELKPIQFITSRINSISNSSTSVGVSFDDNKSYISQFKFISVYAHIRNSNNVPITKNRINLSVGYTFKGGAGYYYKDLEESTNSYSVYSDWIPLSSDNPTFKFDFDGAASEGDNIYVELWGIR